MSDPKNGAVAAALANAALAHGNVGITITQPSPGATVSSPVQFVAYATPPAGRVIDSMRIYVDSYDAYTVYAASLNTQLSIADGVHNINCTLGTIPARSTSSR